MRCAHNIGSPAKRKGPEEFVAPLPQRLRTRKGTSNQSFKVTVIIQTFADNKTNVLLLLFINQDMKT